MYKQCCAHARTDRSTWWRRRRVVASYRPATRPAVIEKAAESRVVYFLPIYVFISTTTPRLRDTPLKTTKLKISHHGVGWRLVHGANQIVAANRANKRRVFGPRLGGRRNASAPRGWVRPARWRPLHTLQIYSTSNQL